MYTFRLGRPSYIARVNDEYSRSTTAETYTSLGSLWIRADATADNLDEDAQAHRGFRHYTCEATVEEGRVSPAIS